MGKTQEELQRMYESDEELASKHSELGTAFVIEVEPKINFNDFLISFYVASGSTEAHALALKALGLKYKMDGIEVSHRMRDLYKNLESEEKQELLQAMGRSHKQNENVKLAFTLAKKTSNYSIDDEMLQQLPNPDNFSKLEQKIKNHAEIEVEILDRALKIITLSSNLELVSRQLKNLAAFLNLYDRDSMLRSPSTLWWNNLDPESKSQMKEEGKRLYLLGTQNKN